MSKRALLWWLGVIAFGFTYAAAVNVVESGSRYVSGLYAGQSHYESYTSCNGMWNFAKWFGRYCSGSLPPRLGVLALGTAVLVVCGYFAEKVDGASRPGMAAVRRPANLHWLVKGARLATAGNTHGFGPASPRASLPTPSTVAEPARQAASLPTPASPDAMGGEQTGEARRITYDLDTEVTTPEGNRVRVRRFEDSVAWVTSEGGVVEPTGGHRFACLSVAYRSDRFDAVGDVADAFMVELGDGSMVDPLAERYSESELQGRHEAIEGGQTVEGLIYFELPDASAPVFAVFDCGTDEETPGLWIQWTLGETVHRNGPIPAGAVSSNR